MARKRTRNRNRKLKLNFVGNINKTKTPKIDCSTNEKLSLRNDTNIEPQLLQLLMDFENEYPENSVEPDIKLSDPDDGNSSGQTNIVGRRIVDLDFFWKKLQEISSHNKALGCSFNNIVINKERKCGLYSKLFLVCNLCGATFKLDTVESAYYINREAVLAATLTGNGFLCMEELFGTLRIPVMCSSQYKVVMDEVGTDLITVSKLSMREAVEEEKALAVAKGEVDTDGLPLLTVVADGVWNKRSYRTNYSSLSGAAAIVGFYTQKVIYMDVKNKFCKICSYHTENPPPHSCNQDYSGSSTGMEANILVQGFSESESEYGCRYKRLIADGDSSVYKKILDSRPYKFLNVQKVECRNHLFRNFRTNLNKIILDKRINISERKLLGTRTERFLYGITKAIRYRKSLDENMSKSIRDLEKDIENSFFHVFGQHHECESYFCDKKDERNRVSELSATMKTEVTTLINRLARHSKSLIFDVESNVVERYNSIVSKMVGGKRVNFGAGQSYRYRCHAAVLQHNTNRAYTTFMETIQPQFRKNELMTKLESWRIKKNIKNAGYRDKAVYKPKTEKKLDQNYGPECQKPDLEPEDFEKEKEKFLEYLKLNQENRLNIEEDTKLQGQCDKWQEIRKNLLTASNFGTICKNRKNSSFSNKVKTILYGSYLNTPAIRHGRDNEKIALQQLEVQLNVKIKPSGLFIDKHLSFLGATPDGLLDDDGIVEIKCPFSAYGMNSMDAISSGKLPYFKTDKKTSIVSFNRGHNYFFQVQGQLHISEKQYCLFAVWTGNDLPLKVEYVKRDDSFWKNVMEKKLTDFYFEQLLPEIIDPRHSRNMDIRGKSTKEATQDSGQNPSD